MLHLINGRGQLGEALAGADCDGEWECYHTWNFLDKSEATQQACLHAFRHWLRERKRDIRVCFISTACENDTPYVRAKREAELLMPRDSLVIRLPNILGRGICKRLLRRECEPYGDIELVSISECARFIIKSCQRGEAGTLRMRGTVIPASLLQEILTWTPHPGS